MSVISFSDTGTQQTKSIIPPQKTVNFIENLYLVLLRIKMRLVEYFISKKISLQKACDLEKQNQKYCRRVQDDQWYELVVCD